MRCMCLDSYVSVTSCGSTNCEKPMVEAPSRSIFAIDREPLELVDHVGPILQELHALFPIERPIVRSSRLILILMSESYFNDALVKSVFIEDGARRRSKT